MKPRATVETILRLELANGSRIISLPGQEETIRGYSGVDLLIVDEAARVEDDLYYSVRPMLAISRGQLIALSTPFGKRGWWFNAWQSSESWQRYQVTADRCPRISKEFLEEERQSMPAAWFRSEYFCEFIEATDAVFTYSEVTGMLSDDIEPLEFDIKPLEIDSGGKK